MAVVALQVKHSARRSGGGGAGEVENVWETQVREMSEREVMGRREGWKRGEEEERFLETQAQQIHSHAHTTHGHICLRSKD